MYDFNSKLVGVLCKVLFIASIGVVTPITISSVFLTYGFPENWMQILVNSSSLRIFISLLGSLVLSCAIFSLAPRIKLLQPTKVGVSCSFVGIVLSIAWCLIVDIPPISDGRDLYELVKIVNEGGVNVSSSDYPSELEYLQRYPYQSGYFLYLYATSRLFGLSNYFALRFPNIICVGVIIFLVGKITEKICDEKGVSNIASLLTAAFLPLTFMSSFIYGNVISLAFSLLACERALAITKLKRISFCNVLACCVSLFLALWFKPNATIFYIAISIWFAMLAIKHKCIKYLLLIASIIITYCFANYSQLFVVKLIINNIEFKGTPLIAWLAMGLQDGDKAPGWYNGYIVDVWIENNGDPQGITNASVQAIYDRLGYFKSMPFECMHFFAKKTATQFCEPTFTSIWATFQAYPYSFDTNSIYYNIYDCESPILTSFLAGKARSLSEIFCDSFQTIVYLFSIVGLVGLFRKINGAHSASLLLIVFLGGFLYFLLFEGKSMYVLPYFVLLIPFTSVGVINTANLFSKLHVASNH